MILVKNKSFGKKTSPREIEQIYEYIYIYKRYISYTSLVTGGKKAKKGLKVLKFFGA